jgi:hypothetical protein
MKASYPVCKLANMALILEIHLHIPGYDKEVIYGTHARIKKSGPVDVAAVIMTELKSCKGKVLVSSKLNLLIFHSCTNCRIACADRDVADQVRTEVKQRMDRRVRLVELDFQPSLRARRRLRERQRLSSDMEFKCRG